MLERMNTFLTVVKTQSFTKAAQQLNMTQPGVSQQMKYLEEYYGAELFQKKGRYIELTEAGKVFQEYAIKIKSLERQLFQSIQDIQSKTETYRLGATMTIGGYVLPYILEGYHRVNSQVDLILYVHNTEMILKQLTNGDIQLAVVEGPFDKSKFHYTKWKDDELLLACSPQHPFAKKEMLTLQEILQGKLILREPGSGTRQAIENAFLQQGYSLDPLKGHMEIGSMSAIISLVEANMGYTILSTEAVKKEVERESVLLKPVADMKIQREFNFVYLETHSFIDSFVSFCRKY
ncbi:MAG: LysR family transcriptional regulator [Epulopiscium sp.]|nr:LysR family transcriptional regulator [Candidatus Epulonipiscium sp.]